MFCFSLFSPESVIKRFEQRDHAVDSRGVAEYLRALVVTNAITEYLPDEETGKPSSLPTLVIKPVPPLPLPPQMLHVCDYPRANFPIVMFWYLVVPR
jgi:hypothetical protein